MLAPVVIAVCMKWGLCKRCAPLQPIPAHECMLPETPAVDSIRAAFRVRLLIALEEEARIPAMSLTLQDEAKWHHSCKACLGQSRCPGSHL